LEARPAPPGEEKEGEEERAKDVEKRQWQVSVGPGDWNDYSEDVNALIELGRMENKEQCIVDIGKWQYEISLKDCTQTNTATKNVQTIKSVVVPGSSLKSSSLWSSSAAPSSLWSCSVAPSAGPIPPSLIGNSGDGQSAILKQRSWLGQSAILTMLEESGYDTLGVEEWQAAWQKDEEQAISEVNPKKKEKLFNALEEDKKKLAACIAIDS